MSKFPSKNCNTLIHFLTKEFTPSNFTATVISQKDLLATPPKLSSEAPPQRLLKVNPIINVKISDDGRLQIVSGKEVDEKILRKVGGKDGRIRILQTEGWPYKVHGHLIMTFPNGKQYVGSGTMVGPCHVLTAGHNLYSHSRGEGWASKVTFIPAQNEEIAPWGEAEGGALLSVKGWVNNNDPRLSMPYDMGMVILNREIGKLTGWAGLLCGSDATLKPLTVNVTGYPGDKGEPDHWSTQMWTMGHKVKSLEEEKLYYDIDTFQGQSGSGLWAQYNEECYAVGIHTYGEGEEGKGNSATRITEEKFKCIIAWLNGQYRASANFEEAGYSISMPLDTDIDTVKQELIEFLFGETLKQIHTSVEVSPTCFLSYAWGVPEHEKLVHKLAANLKEAGINVSLDIWDNKAGTRISRFTETISKSDYVILVGSEQLMKKYTAEESGAVLNLEIDQIIEKLRIKPGSVIPLLLDGTKKTSLPPALGTVVYIDFKNPKAYYLQTFELAGRLLPDKDLSSFIREFNKQIIQTEEISFDELLTAKRKAENRDRALTAKAVRSSIQDFKDQLSKNFSKRKAYYEPPTGNE